MVLKIQRPANMPIADGGGGGDGGDRAENKNNQRRTKKQKMEYAAPATGDSAGASVDAAHAAPPPPLDDHDHHNRPSQHLCCAGCGVAESASSGPLLLFEDPEEDSSRNDGRDSAKDPGDEKRYCAGCMTGKKVRVFWPVDSQWYIADVQRYDADTGEHLLRYPDGDTEWVRIGEDHTTNTQYKEYFRNHGEPAGVHRAEGGGSLTRPPSMGGGMSFALSAISQSFGLPATTVEDEKTMRLKPPSQQQRLFQQLNLDRTASSMSSFGMYPGGGNGGGVGTMRQPSFGGQHGGGGGGGGGRVPPFQILSPNFSHSFSSKIGSVPSMDYGPPPPAVHPSGKPGETAGRPPPLPPPYSHAPPPPHHHHQQQREEGSVTAIIGGSSPGTRDGVPGSHWPPSHQYSNPNYFGGGHQNQVGYPYPTSQQPAPQAPSYDCKQPLKTQPLLASAKPLKGGKKDMLKSRKALAKAWTKAEDEYLLDLVLQMKHPLKWSIIAQSLSDFSAERGGDTPVRTGKQCRERYVNHLNPRLKHSEFTPLEDATIWRLYATIGTQWAKMSKVIPGRTDNNLKNRFHNLKRQLQREEDGRLRAPEPEGYREWVHAERVREIPQCLRTKIEDMWNHKRHIGVISASSVRESREDDAAAKDDELVKDGGDNAVESSTGAVAAAEDQRLRKFGPFEPVSEPSQCGRCGLFVPSVQCGNEICTRTKWCGVCTRVSMHLGGNILRECLNLRKSEDLELAKGVEKIMAKS